MKTRVAIGFLWAYLGWYGWSMYAGLAGINVLWGPAVVLAAIAMVAALHLVRRVDEAAPDSSAVAPTGSAPAEARLGSAEPA